MQVKLLPIDAAGEPIPLNRQGRIVLGRSGQLADIVLPHSSVSKCHCEIVISEDRVVVRDLNSHNGTRVNQRLVTEADLNNGDELAIAELQFLVRIVPGKADVSADSLHEMLAASGIPLDAADDGVLDVHALLERAAATSPSSPIDDPRGFDRAVSAPREIFADSSPLPPSSRTTKAESASAADTSPTEIPNVSRSSQPTYEPVKARADDAPRRSEERKDATPQSDAVTKQHHLAAPVVPPRPNREGPVRPPSNAAESRNTAAEILHNVNSLAIRSVKKAAAENAGQPTESGFAWPELSMRQILMGAAVLAAVVVLFLSLSTTSSRREQEIFDTYTRIWDELRVQRAGSATAEEWNDFRLRATAELTPIVADLTETASSAQRTKQVLLWAGRDCLPKMLESAHSEESRAEKAFTRYMVEAQNRLPGK